MEYALAHSRDKIQLSYRHQKVDGLVIPGGGTLSDGGMRATSWLGTTMQLLGSAQYEKWNFTVLVPGAQSDVTTSVQFTFWPGQWK
jgi:hypothetical protein